MAVKLPLVITNGQVQQLQAGDTISTGTLSVSTPTRALGVAFQPSTTRDVLGIYSVRILSSLSLAGGQQGRIELLCDAANPPTTIRARVAGGSTGALTIGLNIADVVEAPLIFKVPATWFVLIRSVNETGTPTYSITTQAEELD